MSAKALIADSQAKMTKALEFVAHEFASLHTGRASPAMVEGLLVQAYGSSMHLRELAAITTPDARTIQITPWDKGVTKEIEKAIQTANLGFNPRTDGQVIRIPLPELTGDRRKELVKVTHGLAEEGRIRVRHARRDAMEGLKKLCTDKLISEDDLKRFEKDVQGQHDAAIGKIAEAVTRKEKELTTV